MKVYAISDLHLPGKSDKPMDIFGPHWEDHFKIIKEDWQARVLPEDVVLLAGDLSWAMRIEDANEDIAAVAALPGRKVILKGNHDFWWSGLAKVRRALPESVYAVQNDCIRIDNLLVCGSRGWNLPDATATEDDKAIYARELIRLELSLTEMQRKRKEDDLVVGMTHYPPFDAAFNDSDVTALFTRFNVNKIVYGHLHGTRSRYEPVVVKGNSSYYLTSCDLVKNRLIEIL